MKMNSDQFVFWLEGFIASAPGITHQARGEIQAKIQQMREPAPSPYPQISDLVYRGTGRLADGIGETALPVFVAQAAHEGHFPHIGTRTMSAIHDFGLGELA